jgi:hypothetical protein
LVSPDYPSEVFSRKSFQGFAENVSDWRTLKRAVELWQGYKLSYQQEQSMKLFAPAMGILSQRERAFKETGYKLFRNKIGRYQLRDSKGRFVKVEGRKSHHKEKVG